MRVLYDFVIFRMETYGGISRYIVELARGLAANGLADVTLLCGLHCNRLVSGLPRTLGLRVAGFRVESHLAQSRLVGALDYGLLRVARTLGRGWDVYHPSYYPRHLRRAGGSRLVVTVHDMIHERFPEYHRGDPTAERKRRAVAAADLVICGSRRTAVDLQERYGIDESRMRVIYYGVGAATDAGVAAGGASDAGAAVRPYLLYVGKRGRYKNFRALLEVYLQDARLRQDVDLVCFGGEPFTPAERAAMRERHAGEHVRQVRGDDATLASYYQGATALVVTSLYEGFGLPLVEAMRLGCPVVAHGGGAIPEVLGGAGLVCDCTDPAVLHTALHTIVYDAEVRAKLVALGRRRATQFSWERTVSETFAAYRDVVSSPLEGQ